MLSFFVWRLSSLDARGIAKVSAANVLLLLRIMKNWRELRKYSDRADFYKLLPAPAIVFAHQLLRGSECDLFITEPRKARLGCFARRRYKSPYIELNNDLTPYFMLIVFLHEWAHFMTWKEFGNRVSPHGKEWKQNFRYLLIKLRNSNRIPIILRDAIDAEADSLKGNIYSNHMLLNAIKIVDKHAPQLVLHELPHNSHFKVVDRAETFRKKEKIRLRYKCYNLANKKWYTIYASTPVEKVN